MNGVPDWLQYMIDMIFQGKFLDVAYIPYERLIGDLLWTVLGGFTLTILYIKSGSLAFAMFVGALWFMSMGFLWAPELLPLAVIMFALGIASVLYQIAHPD